MLKVVFCFCLLQINSLRIRRAVEYQLVAVHLDLRGVRVPQCDAHPLPIRDQYQTWGNTIIITLNYGIGLFQNETKIHNN